MTAARTRRWAGWATLAWMALIFVASSIPGSGIPSAAIFRFDKLLHFAVYAVLGALLRAWRGPLWLTVLLGAAWGASDEFHQWFVPGRFVESADLLADALGALVGGAAVVLVERRLQRQRTPAAAPEPTDAR